MERYCDGRRRSAREHYCSKGCDLVSDIELGGFVSRPVQREKENVCGVGCDGVCSGERYGRAGVGRIMVC